MKTIVLTILVLASVNLVAQDQWQLRAYSTAAFGSNLAVEDANYSGGERGFTRGLGLNGGLEFFVVDNISVNLGFTQYFKTTGNQINSTFGSRNWFYQASYANLNGKYYVDNGTTWLQTYGLAGFAFFKSDYRVQGTFKRPITETLGVNFGIGAIVLTDDWWNIITEFRYSTPEGAQDTPSGGSTIISIGLLYVFD